MSALTDENDNATEVPPIDFEAKIESHTLKIDSPKHKKKSKTFEVPHKKTTPFVHVEECVPLLIEDIPKIAFPLGSKINKSVFGVPFRRIMIYGHLIPLKFKCNNNERIYSIDDGTGSITVHHQYTKEHTELARKIDGLNSQVMHVKKNGYLQLGQEYADPKGKECQEIVDCMEILLRRIKKQIYLPNEYYRRGSKVSVVGNPYRARNGDIEIWAYEITEDIDQDRSKEINFKRNLARMYQNVYKRNEAASRDK